jgi:hypothetical protein
MSTQRIIQELTTVPGVGPSIAEDLRELGIRGVRDLKRKSPERLYERLCEARNTRIDPCVLYAFRCAVYYATAKRPRPDLLKWWNWKGRPSFKARAR